MCTARGGPGPGESRAAATSAHSPWARPPPPTPGIREKLPPPHPAPGSGGATSRTPPWCCWAMARSMPSKRSSCSAASSALSPILPAATAAAPTASAPHAGARNRKRRERKHRPVSCYRPIREESGAEGRYDWSRSRPICRREAGREARDPVAMAIACPGPVSSHGGPRPESGLSPAEAPPSPGGDPSPGHQPPGDQ